MNINSIGGQRSGGEDGEGGSIGEFLLGERERRHKII